MWRVVVREWLSHCDSDPAHCHHLDAQRFGWYDSPHTRGFYARIAALYHHARGTPMKQLCWIQLPRGRWRIDWRRTHRGG